MYFQADKKRQSVQEAFLKTTHQARQEAAQARREEKTRERKQRLLEEEDPEKQRRLEVDARISDGFAFNIVKTFERQLVFFILNSISYRN